MSPTMIDDDDNEDVFVGDGDEDVNDDDDAIVRSCLAFPRQTSGFGQEETCAVSLKLSRSRSTHSACYTCASSLFSYAPFQTSTFLLCMCSIRNAIFCFFNHQCNVLL